MEKSEEELNDLTAKINRAKLELETLEAEKKKLQLNIISILIRQPLDFISLKVGEIIELKQEHFLTNLRYIKSWTRETRNDSKTFYQYSIGGRAFTVDDLELHEMLLKYRSLIDTLVLEATEYQRPLLDDYGSVIEGESETVSSFAFITAITNIDAGVIDKASLDERISKAKLDLDAKIKRKVEEAELDNTDDDEEGRQSEEYTYYSSTAKYGGAFGYSDATIDAAFDGNLENYLNID